MDELKKIDPFQLYGFWKTLAISIFMVIVMLSLVRILPDQLTPVIDLVCAGALYGMTLSKRNRGGNCIRIPYAIILSMVLNAFLCIIADIADWWKISGVSIPDELVSSSDLYLPALSYLPIAFLTILLIYLKRDRLSLCKTCRLSFADEINRNKIEHIFRYESHLQMKYLLCIFGFLSVLVWCYYLFFYVNININERDHYVFLWIVILGLVADEVYFAVRYYNLYLDLKVSGDIINESEISDNDSKTYLRFYVICGNNVYVNPEKVDPSSKYGKVIDTPFFTHREVSGIALSDVKRIISSQTGREGDLRFFYGRKFGSHDRAVIRYFYFLDPDENGALPTLQVSGEWMDYERIKHIYSTDPGQLAPLSVIDTTRLSTIILTYKKYDERGYRRNKLHSYEPSFNLIDVRNSSLDFQDDKWIQISMLNADIPFFAFKRFWRRLLGKTSTIRS